MCASIARVGHSRLSGACGRIVASEGTEGTEATDSHGGTEERSTNGGGSTPACAAGRLTRRFATRRTALLGSSSVSPFLRLFEPFPPSAQFPRHTTKTFVDNARRVGDSR